MFDTFPHQFKFCDCTGKQYLAYIGFVFVISSWSDHKLWFIFCFFIVCGTIMYFIVSESWFWWVIYVIYQLLFDKKVCFALSFGVLAWIILGDFCYYTRSWWYITDMIKFTLMETVTIYGQSNIQHCKSQNSPQWRLNILSVICTCEQDKSLLQNIAQQGRDITQR